MVGQASRRNSRLSTGPKTENGKAIASKNSEKHGLLSQNLALIDGEDLSKFEGILQSLIDKYNPIDCIEFHFVNQIAMFMMRQYRIFAYESALANVNCIEIPPDKYPQFKIENIDLLQQPTEFNIEQLEDEKRRLTWLRQYIEELEWLPNKRSKNFQDYYENIAKKILAEIDELFHQPYSSYSQINYPSSLITETKEKQLEIIQNLHKERSRIDREKSQQQDDYYWPELESIRFLMRISQIEFSQFKNLIEKITKRINNIERLIIEINHHHSERQERIKEKNEALKALSYFDIDRLPILQRYEAHNNRQLKQATEQLEARIKARKDDKI